jgi:hypothetical protein
MSEIPDIRLGYIFILKDEKDLSSLKDNLVAINDKNPLWIGVSNLSVERNEYIADLIRTTNPDIKYNIVSNFEDIDDLYKLDQFLKEYKNGWTLVNIAGQPFKTDAREILTEYINNKREVFCLILNNKEEEVPQVNNLCYFNFIYVALKGNMPDYIKEDDSFITKSFFDKVNESQPSMIRTWEELS